MSADSPRRSSGCNLRGMIAVPTIVPPQVVSDRSILDSAIGFINEVTLAHQPPIDPKDTITWARFETSADISDPRFGEDWELEGNVAPPLLLILGYGLGVQVWAIPANGEAVEVLSWRHGIVSALRVLPTPTSTVAVEENGRADEPIDAFAEKRPLIALVDGSSTSGSQPQFCAVNLVSLKTGAQVKTIKFKNPVIDILANRSSVVITFHERIAVFDARTLEDRLSITTCYPSPGINPNPIALGPRWLAYAENKLLPSKRSGGGCDGDGVASYTATVLNASKSLVKGLRELGEQVAAGLTGTSGSAVNSKNTSFDSGCGSDSKQSGIVTVIDIKNPLRDHSPTSGVSSSSNQTAGNDTIIAHFIAHSEALVAMEFDNSGMLLITADRRGHDFHVFRIQPNPVGSSLAAVHHLYILHRGDTTAKVQNITLTLDSRWVAVSTLRGTTHVFPITPYGGTMGVRTHSSLHVVNKLSRFHRSAGLSAEGRSNSPISHSESTTFTQSLQPYHNSTLPPFPRPTVVMPLAQLRQPFALGSPPGSTTLTGVKSAPSGSGSGSQRQRLSSLSDDSGKPLSVCAIFAKSRSWLLDPPNVTREAPHRMQRKAVDSLFVMAGHGALIQYDLDTKLASNVAKEKICDDTPIELEVEAKAQWNLGRRKEGSPEIMPPLSPDNWLIKNRNSCMLTDSTRQYDESDDRSESWLSQVEIITHAGPHRRLWMGPQFVFKTYNTPSGSNLSHVDIEAVEIGTSKSSTTTSEKLDHSTPLNMPLTAAVRSSAVPVLIESGSYSSIEQSPKLMDRFRHDHLDSDFSIAHGDSRLKEDLADAMRESPSAVVSNKDTGGHVCEITGSSDNVAFYDALTAEDIHARSASAAALANVLPNIHSYDNSSSYESLDSMKKPKASIEKIVNPLGTVTTVTSCLTADVKTDILDEVVSQLAAEDTIIHENCDESLFRPVVAIFCDEKALLQREEEEARKNNEQYQPPEIISNKLVVPVIAKEINDELSKREKDKSSVHKSKAATCSKNKGQEQSDSVVLPPLNENSKELEIKGHKICNLKNSICINELSEENDSQKSKSLVLSDENKKQKDCSLFPKSCEKKKAEFSKNSDTSKKMFIKTTEKVCEKSSSQKVVKLEVDSLKAVTIKPNNDKVNKLKIQKNVECKSQCKKKIEEFELLKNKDKSSNSKGIHEQDNDAKTKNIVKDPKENNDITSGNVMSVSKSAQDETIRNKMGNEKTEINIESNSANDTIKSNTATKENVKKSKNCIKNTNIDESNCTIITQPTVHQSAYSLDEIEINKMVNVSNENVDKIQNEIKLRTGKSNLCKSELNLINEQNIDASICSINKSKVTVLTSSKLKTLKPSGENLTELVGTNQIKINNGKNKDLNNSNDLLENKHLDIQMMKKTTLDDENLSKFKSEKCPTNTFYDNLNKKITSNDLKCAEDNYEKNKSINKYRESCKKLTNVQVNKENTLEIKRQPEELRIERKNNDEKDIEKVENIDKEENKEEASLDTKSKELKNIDKDFETNEFHDIETKSQTDANETKIITTASNSPKKKGKGFLKNELKKDSDISKKISSNLSTINIGNSEIEECLDKTEVENNGNNLKLMNNDKNLSENTLCAWKETNKVTNEIQTSSLTPASAWKTLSGAEMINKNLKGSDNESIIIPPLENINKLNVLDKLLPELPTPNDTTEQASLDDFSVNSLDTLPPLPALEPLQLMTENKNNPIRDISLINFESPLQENRTFQTKITPAPRGFTEENLILALCGNLYYENEHVLVSTDTTELSPTFSSNHSSAAFEETSLADYKSLTENDDPYMSLEQSSQDTNTTTTNTTNEKFSSSSNSSGSEEIVIMEEKKMTKKQKRKKQQQLKELQKQKEQQQQQQEIDDEELRPLIAMTDSQVEQTANGTDETLLAIVQQRDKNQPSATQPFINTNTTDSDGPMPATTSDDNVFPMPVPLVHNPHKIKTKKLEHKINLIAAIEAATSSSTSSAEESGVELGRRASHDNEESLISVSSSISNSTMPLPIAVTPQTTVGASKKKTKRRKR